MKQTFTIPQKLVTLNEYTHKHWQATGKDKKDMTYLCTLYMGKLVPIEAPVKITCFWKYWNRAKDLGNVEFGKKFIEDALQQKGIITNDNSNVIIAHEDYFIRSKDEGVTIILETVEKDYCERKWEELNG